MVKSSGNRVIYFLFGITVGLLVGAGFFIFKIDEYISRIELFNKQGSDSLLTETIDEQPRKVYDQQPTVKNTEKQQGADSVQITLQTNPKDSFFADSLFRTTRGGDELFEVKKDELVTTREISISTQSSEIPNAKDSALKDISGIREDKDASGSITVEFWLSPINYRGYKMSKGKLVLFGMSANADVLLFRSGGFTVLRHGDSYYRLENTSEFRPMEKTSPPEGSGN
ncbi:MAG: hypothetical protein IT233_04985 [Bacteroidia bacterium]|nr:hypothetical protein [Bacteroidia bacterium]